MYLSIVLKCSALSLNEYKHTLSVYTHTHTHTHTHNPGESN
jgi:hypothetical protein